MTNSNRILPVLEEASNKVSKGGVSKGRIRNKIRRGISVKRC